jgi:ubiquinone/menaquinone biosynthesis C-methylase UbiE
MDMCWSYSRLDKAVVKEVAKEFTKNHTVLDVGCGFGKSTKMIEDKGDYIIGIDVEIFFDKSKFSHKVNFVSADAFSLPFRDETFDAVISLDVIEHVPDDSSFLCEIKRVLKVGGIFLVGTPNKGRLTNRVKAMFGSLRYPMYVGDCSGRPQIHLREYSKEELIRHLRINGFRLKCIQEIWLGFPPYNVGLEHFPKILKSFATYILVKSERVQ